MTDSISKETELLISRWGDPDMAEPERAKLQKLLAGSAEARELLRQYQSLDGQLASLPEPAAAQGENVEQLISHVRQVIGSGQGLSIQQPGLRRGGGRLGRVGIAASFVAAALAGLGLWWIGREAAGPPGVSRQELVAEGGRVAKVKLWSAPPRGVGAVAQVSLAETQTGADQTDGEIAQGAVLLCSAPVCKLDGAAARWDNIENEDPFTALFF